MMVDKLCFWIVVVMMILEDVCGGFDVGCQVLCLGWVVIVCDQEAVILSILSV